jgi:hypothetical protein
MPTFQPPQRPGTSPPPSATPRTTPRRPQPFTPRTQRDTLGVAPPPPTAQPPTTQQPRSPAAPAPVQPATAYQPDQQIEIESAGRWHPGRVIRIEGTGLHVSYDGWDEVWNETVDPARVRPR